MKPSSLRLNLSPTDPRECTSCGKVLSPRHYPKPITLRSGYVSVPRCCRACANARRRKGPGFANRPPKRNAAGLYHCRHCRRYLPAGSFGMNQHGKPAPNCHDCRRKLGRLRYARSTPTQVAQQRAYEQKRQREARVRNQLKAKQQVDFAKDAVLILRRRGLTKSHISLLGQFSKETVTHWERGNREHCEPSTMNRLVALMRATAFLPLREQPVRWTRKRHPEWDRIVEELRWERREA